MDDAKRCPFCGKEPHIFSKLCNCENSECAIYEITFTIEQWNKRPIEDELRKQLDDAGEYLMGEDN